MLTTIKKSLPLFLFFILSSNSWASFPTTGILATFTGANNSTTLGSNWVNDTTWVDPTGITSNTAYDSSYATEGLPYWNVNTFSGTLEAYVTLSTLGGGSSDGSGVIFSSNKNTGNMYKILNDNDGAHVDVLRNDAYSQTLLTQFAKTPANGDSIGASINTATGLITVYYKSGAGAWTALGSTTDTTYNPNYIGLFFGDGIVRYTNFGGGTTANSVSISGKFRATGKLSVQ